MDKTAISGLIKQAPWQLDFPCLHTFMSLPEKHTDVSIYGLIGSFSKKFFQFQSRKKSLFYISKKSKQGINS